MCQVDTIFCTAYKQKSVQTKAGNKIMKSERKDARSTPEITIGTAVEGRTIAEIGTIRHEAEEKINWMENVPVKFTDGTCGIVIYFPDGSRAPSLRKLRSPLGRKLLEQSVRVPQIVCVGHGLHIYVTPPEAERKEEFFDFSIRIEYPWADMMDLDPRPEGICRFAKPDRW